jgi:hypothetical protein
MPGPNPMYKSPHKKYSGWSRGYVPEFGTRIHSHNNSGNVPVGKKKRKDRVKVQPLGWPQGAKVNVNHGIEKGKGPIDDCFCGRCYHLNNGPERLKYG